MSHDLPSTTVIRANPLTDEVKNNVAAELRELAVAFSKELGFAPREIAMAGHGSSKCPKINAVLNDIREIQSTQPSTQQAQAPTTKPRSGFARV